MACFCLNGFRLAAGCFGLAARCVASHRVASFERYGDSKAFEFHVAAFCFGCCLPVDEAGRNVLFIDGEDKEAVADAVAVGGVGARNVSTLDECGDRGTGGGGGGGGGGAPCETCGGGGPTRDSRRGGESNEWDGPSRTTIGHAYFRELRDKTER